MDHRLLLLFVLTAIIHFINTLTYSVRLAGVKTARLALAFSLFNVIFIASSTANAIQAPLMAKKVEDLITSVGTVAAGQESKLLHSAVYQQGLSDLTWEIRGIILAATLGTILGTIFVPIFVRWFSKGIFLFEETRSIPKLVMRLFSANTVKSAVNDLKNSKIEQTEKAKQTVQSKRIPKKFLLMNVFVTGIYTTAVLSSLYAGALNPDLRSTASTLASIINGVATIMLVTLIDPRVASIVDQALRRERPVEDVEDLVKWLSYSRIIGTVVAQLFFIPAAEIVEFISSDIIP